MPKPKAVKPPVAVRDPAQAAPDKRITRMQYGEGPMGFLGDQIRKEMQRAGYNPKRFILYRSPVQQQAEYDEGDSRAKPYSSAHQYYCAEDIIDTRWAWFGHPDAPDGTAFWDTLWDCVALVSEKYNVEFAPRLSWDAAHVELKHWRAFRDQIGTREPSCHELDEYFARVLPAVWKQYQRSKAAS